MWPFIDVYNSCRYDFWILLPLCMGKPAQFLMLIIDAGWELFYALLLSLTWITCSSVWHWMLSLQGVLYLLSLLKGFATHVLCCSHDASWFAAVDIHMVFDMHSRWWVHVLLCSSISIIMACFSHWHSVHFPLRDLHLTASAVELSIGSPSQLMQPVPVHSRGVCWLYSVHAFSIV